MPTIAPELLKSISKDIFFIKCTEDKYIVSLPLRGVAFYSGKAGVDELQRTLRGNSENIRQETLDYVRYLCSLPIRPISQKEAKPLFGPYISIILHQKCNFECIYCFAHDARGNESLSQNDIKFIIDQWAKGSSDHKKITFIGGGEPTLSWDLLRWSIEYIHKIFAKENVKIVLVTNGSLLSHERISFLKCHNVIVSLSFDILPDIQDRQRKLFNSTKSSFEAVDCFLKDAYESRLSCEIRCTVTPSIVQQMADMVRFVADNYKGVRKIHFEHVTSSKNPEDFYSKYTDAFFEAREIGRRLGLTVYNSISSSQGKVRHSFCSGTSCFVPTQSGEIICTACHRASSEKDELMNTFKKAIIHQDQTIEIFNRPHEMIRGAMPECETCHAKWQCAGSCVMERLVIGPKLFIKRCEMVREFNKRLLEEQLN